MTFVGPNRLRVGRGKYWQQRSWEGSQGGLFRVILQAWRWEPEAVSLGNWALG